MIFTWSIEPFCVTQHAYLISAGNSQKKEISFPLNEFSSILKQISEENEITECLIQGTHTDFDKLISKSLNEYSAKLGKIRMI